MKTKLIYAGIIAAIFIIAMIIYRDTLTLEGIILIVVANIGSITAIWKWINAKESVSNLRQENHALRAMHKAEFRKNQINKNTMATLKGNLEIIKAQAQWVKNNPNSLVDVLQQQIDNLDLMIEAVKNDTLNPTLTPPPPAP